MICASFCIKKTEVIATSVKDLEGFLLQGLYSIYIL